MMSEKSVSRRRFIQSTSVAALALGTPRRILGANDKISLAIIGTGGRGRRLLTVVTHVPDFQMVSVCDLVEDRMDLALEICAQYKPTPKKYLDFREMLEKEKPDACIVATEEANHAKCAIPVMEAGVHCFCEKPVDITVEKVDQVTRVARSVKTIYQIGFQRHYVPAFQQCIQHIHDGKLGKITFLQGMWQWEGGVGGRYLDMDLSGCWFLAQACHHTDTMAWVMQQPPLQCEAMGAVTEQHEKAPEHCAEDHSAVAFRFPGDVIFSYTHLMNCCKEFTGEKLWVYCEKGGVDLPKAMIYPRSGMGEPQQITEPAADWDAGTSTEIEGFARHIKNGEKPLADLETARIGTLMGIMGGMAMYDRSQRKWEPRIVKWEDLGSTT